MKQSLVLIIILTLLSFMTALVCTPNTKIICVEIDISSCKCVPLDYAGNYVVSHSCNNPEVPSCEGNSKSVDCKCQK